MAFYKADDVRPAARGNWHYIISALAPHADEALRKPGKHVPCPIHGGTDGFRVFKKDFLETGGGVCNTCGKFHDGFKLLMWLNDWNFKETLAAVGEFLRVEKYSTGEELQRLGKSSTTNAKIEELVQQQPDGQAEEHGTAHQPIAPQQEEGGNVIPMLMAKSKPWLEEVKAEMEQRAKTARRYSAKVGRQIIKVWEECFPLSAEAVEPMRAYFQHRELLFRWDKVEKSDSLRFHPSLPYHDEDGILVGKFPAIVGAIRDVKGDIVTLHRVYLTSTGKKARVPCPKKMMSIPDDREIMGAAIRLGEPTDGIIGVAEGIETALSPFRATHIPVWATVNATLMEGFLPPEGVHTVLIWADKDKSATGEKSAAILKSRLEAAGINAITLVPKIPIPARAKGVDWNDVLLTQGVMGFPRGRYLREFLQRRACS